MICELRYIIEFLNEAEQFEKLRVKLDEFKVQYEIFKHEEKNCFTVVFEILTDNLNYKGLLEILPKQNIKSELERRKKLRKSGKQVKRIGCVGVQFNPRYTLKEYNNAKWLGICFHYDKGIVENHETLFKGKCYIGESPFGGFPMYNHWYQQDLIELKSKIKWGNHFMCSSVDANGRCICDDRLKLLLEKSNVNGIEFKPVLKHSTKEPFDNAFQIEAKNTVPIEAIKPIQSYVDDSCPVCGEPYFSVNGPCPIYQLDDTLLDGNIDMYFISSIQGPSYIVSNRLYRILKENGMARGIGFEPMTGIYDIPEIPSVCFE